MVMVGRGAIPAIGDFSRRIARAMYGMTEEFAADGISAWGILRLSLDVGNTDVSYGNAPRRK